MRKLQVFTVGGEEFEVAVGNPHQSRAPMAKAREIGMEGVEVPRDDGGFDYHPPHQILRVEYLQEGEA